MKYVSDNTIKKILDNLKIELNDKADKEYVNSIVGSIEKILSEV